VATTTRRLVPLSAAAAMIAVTMTCGVEQGPAPTLPTELSSIETVDLPAADEDGTMSLERALKLRRSVRLHTTEPLTTKQLSQLLWAAQGTTRSNGFRTAPSAGALYPVEVFALTPDGVFHYLPKGHRLELLSRDDIRASLVEPQFNPAVIIVITAIYQRTEVKYGVRSERYVKLEAGHVAQNLLLQAVALDLGAAPIGAFDDLSLQRRLGLPEAYEPLYMIWVGHPAE